MLATRFPAARYRFDFKVETPIRLHEYAGSALRGAFGRALRRTACQTGAPECKPCALYRTCPYPAIFETPAPETHRLQKFSRIPSPYVIEPPGWGESCYAPGDVFSFHMVVIGSALQHLPLIIHAWQLALERGIGPENGRARLAAAWHCLPDTETRIFNAADGRLADHAPLLPPAPAAQNTVTLVFSSQLRLQQNGRPLRADTVTAERLLVGLAKRIGLVDEFHGTGQIAADYSALSEKAAGVKECRELVWRDWTRYSSRQKREMTLGGLIGTWTLEGELEPFWPFLHLGQWLHVGKNATFGLGQYSLRC